MKLTLSIDQTASLIAGLDAPNSTLVIDVPAADIPADVRALIMPQYDIASGQFRGVPANEDRAAAGYPTLPECRVPAVLANCDAAGALSALSAYADALRARAAALVRQRRSIRRNKRSSARNRKRGRQRMPRRLQRNAPRSLRAPWRLRRLTITAPATASGSTSPAMILRPW